MSSGKKGKKTSKKSTISLGEFLTDGNSALASQVQVAVPVKPRDWADECDDDDDDRPMRTQMIALPTAPRATRLLNDDTVPHNPPFQAYMSNLPYDLNDEDVYVFFDGMEIVSLRLPRDDSDSGRLRGFGYVEFAKRQDLIDALSIPEPMMNGRRIRIDFSSEGDRNRNQRNNRYNNDNYGGDSDRPMGNWRDAPRLERDQGQRRPYNSYNRDRGDRDGGERGDSDRGSRYGSSEGGAGGNWRLGDRPSQPAPTSPPSSRRGFDRGGAERVGDRGGFRRGPPGADRSGDRGGRREMEPPMERPKLVLQPRTLPLPEKPKPESEPEGSERDVSPDSKSQEDKENEEQAEPRPKPTPVPAAKLFGDAKPVDTAAKLREIEERLQEKERQRKAAAAEAAAAAAAAAASTAEEEDGKEKSDPSKDDAGEEHSEGKTAAKKPEEVNNWRVRSETDQKDRGQSPSRRYTKRNDDYSNFSDNRDRDNRDRRDNRNMRDNRRDFNRPNDRGGDRGDRGFRRGDAPRDDREPRREQPVKSGEAKPIEERMPKFQEPTGPNLSMQNTFEGLSADEVDD